jgi:hypothetical protein
MGSYYCAGFKMSDPTWTLANALELCRTIEHVIKHFGFHVGLRGGVLLNGSSVHDLDLIIYPHDSTVWRRRELYEVLCQLGLTRQKTVAQVHAGWRALKSTDEKPIEIWSMGDRVIDIFYAGFEPYAGPLKKYVIWTYPDKDIAWDCAVDRNLENYVEKYGQKRLDYRTIEASSTINAAELWVAKDAKTRADHNNQVAIVYDDRGKFVAIVNVLLQEFKFKGQMVKS